MAMDGEQNTVAIKPQPSLVIKKKEGYEFKVIDFGSAGVQLCVCRGEQAPYWDKDAAVLLDLDALDKLGCWIAKATGRPAKVLPVDFRIVLKAIIRKNKNRKSKFLTEKERLVLKEALRLLNALLAETTPTGKQVSLAARALSRG